MTRFKVFYAKTLPTSYAKTLPTSMDTPDSFNPFDYVELGVFEAEDLNDLHRRMQAERLDALTLDKCIARGVHASMSMGDVAQDAEGRYWMAEFAGWKPILEKQLN